jgi:PAS domain S-box-containing protein
MTLYQQSPEAVRRVQILRRYGMLDTRPEEALDDITALAASICDAPIALISLIDEERQWFKSNIGFAMAETPLEASFCSHALERDILIVPDAKEDPRFADNPLVTGEPGIRFYAGVPLMAPEGVALGSLCVMDRVPRTLTGRQEQVLRVLARQVMTQFDLRRRSRELEASERKLRAIFEAEPACVKLLGPGASVMEMNAAGLRLIEADSFEAIAGRSVLPVVAPEDREALREMFESVEREERRTMEFQITGQKGTQRWLEMSAVPFRDEATGRNVVLGVSHDITAYKVAEEKVRRLNRLYAVSSAINQAIARMDDIQDVYEKACRIAVELGGLVMAWVGLIDREGVALDPVARWGRDDGYLDSVRIPINSDGRGPASQAIRSGAAASCPDIAAPDAVFGSKAEALARGYRCCAAFPLTRDGRSTGVLVVYGNQAGYFDTEELQLLNALAGSLSFAAEWQQRERRRLEAEAALRESEQRYRAIVEVSPDAILLYRNDVVTYVNAAGLKLLRASGPGEVIGRKPLDLFVPEFHEIVSQRFKRLREKPGIEPLIEKKIVALDGTIVEVETAAASFLEGGELVVQAVWRDITGRKRTERRFSRLIDGNAQGVFFWKLDGSIIGANDAFLKMTGYAREDVDGGRLRWDAMTPPEFAEADRRAVEQLMARNVCEPFEKEFMREDGSRVPVLLGGARFEDSPDEGVSFALDLTERKNLEHQFLRAQRMESVGTLAGGIAHDLNNVLGPIITSIELLKMRFPDEESGELIDVIASSAHRGAEMVRQVLSFARGVEGKRMELQIKHLVRDIEKIANDTFLKNIRVRASVPANLWTVLGDPTQLHQVLLNLAVNARDAMPNGGTLEMAAENVLLDPHYAGLDLEAKPGPYVVLQVSDNGLGMPGEIIDKIFEPFFTTKEVGKGTGLGLSTSLAIIRSHGGFIRVQSREGKGTSFKIYLPAQTDGTGEAPAEEEVEMPRGNGQRILVIDDEESVRRITRQTLEAFGYRAAVASDGAEAVLLYAAKDADIAVVLTDMTMPVMDGMATIQVLQRINPAVRIIAASGLGTPSQVAQASALGVKHFLPKPYTAQALLKGLKQVLEE